MRSCVYVRAGVGGMREYTRNFHSCLLFLRPWLIRDIQIPSLVSYVPDRSGESDLQDSSFYSWDTRFCWAGRRDCITELSVCRCLESNFFTLFTASYER